MPLANTRLVRLTFSSLCQLLAAPSINPSTIKKFQRKNSGNARNRTLGWWVRSKTATSVLYSPHIFSLVFMNRTVPGKCYNVPPEFLEKKRKPRLEQTPVVEPRPLPADSNRDPKLFPESEPESAAISAATADIGDHQFNNIPAFMPYEAKQALLREMSRADRKLEEEEFPEEPDEEAAGKIERGAAKSGEKPVAVQQGVAVPDTDDRLDEHFFYGNHPVMDYSLSDGSKGTVDQTPRR